MRTSSNSIWTITPARLFLLVLLIILLFVCLLHFPIDDGLRHVGVAFSGEANWGNVYPFSYFSEYYEISPWYGYDLALRKLFSFLQVTPFKPTILKFFFVKLLSLLLCFTVLAVLIYKSEILSEIESFQSLLMPAICVFLFLTPFLTRSMLLRPFIFSTFFLVYSFGQSGYLRGAVSAGALIFLYPYLSWFYILPVVFCHFLIGNKKYAVAALIVLVVFLLFQPPSYWNLQAAIFAAGSIRKQMDNNIGELVTTFSSFYCVMILFVLFLSYPIFHIGRKKLNYGDLLLLVYLLPSIIYIRTFMDVILPLAFVTYSKSFITILNLLLNKITVYFKTFINEVKSEVFERLPQRILNRLKRISNFGGRSNISLKPIILILYAALFAFVIKVNFDQLKSLNDTEDLLSNIPQNSTILSSFNQQYKILFLRPDLKIIPSSEIGMPSPEIRDEYIAFFKFGRLKNLASKISANYLIEANEIYLDPRESRFLQFVGNNNKMTIWKIID